MKKALLVLLGLLVLGGGVFGQARTLPAFRLVLADNFEYGNTYQGGVNNRNMLGGHRIQPNETYTLQIKFTVSRDLEDKLQLGFVDGTPAANWWTQLTWDDNKNIDSLSIENVKAGQEISATLTLKTITGATSANADANQLMFFTEGEGTRNRKNGGTKGPVTINFTEFVLTRN